MKYNGSLIGGTLAEEPSDTTSKSEEISEKMRDKLLSSLVEGKRMEAYAEHRTEDMNYCHFCERIGYKKLPGKKVGEKWVCIDCLRKLKEILDTLDEWEEEMALGDEMQEQLD